MTKRKFRLFLLLMSISLVLLVLLQVFWLRAEYRSSAEGFRRETNLMFRNTMFHISDSIVSGFMQQFMDRPESDQSQRARQDTIIIDRRRQSDTTRLRGAFFESVDPESIGKQYEQSLRDHHILLPPVIIKEETGWLPSSYQKTDEIRDSLPYATQFVPLGMHSYAASFEGVRPMIIRSILPQVGFSVFITMLIALSFVLVARSLRAQQRLIDQKNDFIGNITHELKTPVATAEAAMEAMKNFDVLDNPKQTKEYLDMAILELNRLGMITDKILRTSVFDYEKDIMLQKSPVDMGSVAEEALESFRFQAAHKGIRLSLQTDSDLIVAGHEGHLLQALYNLLDNAMKYASQSNEIIVRLIGKSDRVVVTVSDQGPGIPEAHQKKVFDKFYRLPSGNVHNVKGYGLGLHYVKGVVRAHGGKISLESTPGEGACFMIKLPAYE